MASNAAAVTRGAQELSCTVPGRHRVVLAPRAMLLLCHLSVGPWAACSKPQQALEAALCTRQACLGIMLALKMCVCQEHAPECG